MDRLHKLSPSTSATGVPLGVVTPKRLSARPSTPLHSIDEEKEHESACTPQQFCNPFDVKAESLHLPICSPSVFATIQRKNDGTFRWSIEHLSLLYPADIDETSFPEPWVDEEQEMRAQKAIDTFFSQSSIVPSPWSSSPKDGKSAKSRRRPRMNVLFQDIPSSDAATQTSLSIPPHVDLMEVLGSYYTYNDEQDNSSRENSQEEADLSNSSSLRRKLFVDNEECVSPPRSGERNFHFMQQLSSPVHMRSVQSTPASDVLSSSPITPPNCSDSCNILSSPPISPISKRSDSVEDLQGSFGEDHDGSYKCSTKELFANPAESNMSIYMEYQETTVPSEKIDSGYTTGSISSSQNATSMSISHGFAVSRVTPVTELIEACEFSQTCDMSYQNDTSVLDAQSVPCQKGCFSVPCQKESFSDPCNFQTYPWVPTCCSTPTKCVHL